MSLRNTTNAYGVIAKSLHWLIAVGILVSIFLGLEQADMARGPEKTEVRALHASLAVGLFCLMTIRLAWRWLNDLPAHPEGSPRWQKISASVVHWGLYASVFTQLIAGTMVVSTGGNPLPFFGLFTIPLPVAENRAAHSWWEGVHEYTWRAVAVLLVIHIIAALFNHFIRKNDVLRRMTIGPKH